MLVPPRGRVHAGTAARFVGPALLLLNLSLLGCGVPLAASELTATAEVGAALGVPLGSATEASSRAAGPVDAQAAPGALLAASAPLSTVAPLSTTTPDPAATPGATTTPAPATPTPTPAATASPTPAATVSPVASGTVEATPTPAATSTPATDPAAASIALINAYRAASGRPPLVANASLAAAATAYAQLMGRTNTFGHTGPDGSLAETRIARAGYKGRFKGEALAAGQASADAATRTWLGSPAHNAIISDPSAVEVGIGYAYAPGTAYGHYWVLITGTP